jgi:hypothetical protein
MSFEMLVMVGADASWVESSDLKPLVGEKELCKARRKDDGGVGGVGDRKHWDIVLLIAPIFNTASPTSASVDPLGRQLNATQPEVLLH